MTTLFFEPHITGHRQEYLNHLIDYILDVKPPGEFIFIVHPDFEVLAGLRTNPQLVTYNISTAEHQSLERGNIISRSIRYYRLADKYAKKLSATHLCFMSLIDVQFALGIFRPTYNVSGILFRAFSRLKEGSLRKRMTRFRKFLQTWFFIRRKFIRQVFILNDQDSVDFLNRTYKTNKFQMLPDPIPDWKADPDFSVRLHFGIDSDQKILLHPGSLSERKGTLEILESLCYLSDEVLSKFVLFLLGEPETGMENRISEKLKKVGKEKPNARIIYHNEFVPNSILQSYFNQCDAILTPYSANDLTYSGIVGHALAAGKPVLCIKNGLLGKIIEEYGMGIMLNSNSPQEIAAGIIKMLDADFNCKPFESYIISHTKEIFASKIIGSITD
ncbi:MAG: glycosyltransferase [Chitinophagaceae bacterium]|nr:glycosyltransferase [Chitinophagaceae bacterium]